jgi:hypothetical protein
VRPRARAILLGFLVWLAHGPAGFYRSFAEAEAQLPSCADPNVALVLLRQGRAGSALALPEVARHLAAGFASSQVAICFEASPSQRQVAEVEIASNSESSATVLRIRMTDRVTNKTLERSVDLAAIPEDSQSVLVALYIEELVQASWIEMTLRNRVFLKEHPVSAPPEVQREIEAVLPEAALPTRAPRLRLSLGGALLLFANGLTQAGPDVWFGFRALSWLELSLRVGYRMGPRVSAPHGSIDVQALLGGLFIDPFWRANARLSLHFPQGLDAARVRFQAQADQGAEASPGLRLALIVSHGAGVSVAITPLFSLGVLGRFCWTLLPGEAADDGRSVTGYSGLGGEGALTLDTHF